MKCGFSRASAKGQISLLMNDAREEEHFIFEFLKLRNMPGKCKFQSSRLCNSDFKAWLSRSTIYIFQRQDVVFVGKRLTFRQWELAR